MSGVAGGRSEQAGSTTPDKTLDSDRLKQLYDSGYQSIDFVQPNVVEVTSDDEGQGLRFLKFYTTSDEEWDNWEGEREYSHLKRPKNGSTHKTSSQELGRCIPLTSIDLMTIDRPDEPTFNADGMISYKDKLICTEEYWGQPLLLMPPLPSQPYQYLLAPVGSNKANAHMYAWLRKEIREGRNTDVDGRPMKYIDGALYARHYYLAFKREDGCYAIPSDLANVDGIIFTPLDQSGISADERKNCFCVPA